MRRVGCGGEKCAAGLFASTDLVLRLFTFSPSHAGFQ